MLRRVPLDRLDNLDSPQAGLRSEQVETRRQQYGDNEILEKPPSGWLDLIRDTLKDPMLWFLLGTSGLFMVVGEWIDAVILLIALIPFLGMDFYLHRRTQASTAGLSHSLAVRTTVLRDGKQQDIAATELVPGDLVLVHTGESCPADGIIETAETLLCDESLLTGEAYPVHKQALAALPRDEVSAHVSSDAWLFAGTRIIKGQARLRILYTGAETVYGEIVHSALLGTHARTPLQTAVGNLVAVLLAVAACICAGLAWVRWQQGHGLLDAILNAVTLAVAALPEEFPVVLTFFLGVGVYRMAQRQALVRRAVVVENIGRVSWICSDKTGTLTEGQLKLTHFFPAETVSEEGLLTIAASASRMETNDPVDLAILAQLKSAQVMECVECFPFTEDRKCETAVVRTEGVLMAVVKGAPETVMTRCRWPAAEVMTDWVTRIEVLAESGHKVIACAWQIFDKNEWHGGEPDRDFQFAGVLAFEDPVREGVPAAIQQCRDAQIRVMMITGDHPATALSVAREIGLGEGAPRVIGADDLQLKLQQGDADILYRVDVVARAVPAQKLLLVQALQSSGEIVAVTGDGVNDVSALQAADVGIAMGQRGTRSAREVAAIVLLDDNFRSIVQAIAEGRQLFLNLQLSFQYLLMIHAPLVLTAALLPLAGFPMLYLPVHIVWLELIIHPTALLVFQHTSPATLRIQRSRSGSLQFFTVWQWIVICLVGTAVTLMVTWAYMHSLGADFDVTHARTMALLVLILSSIGMTAVLSRMRSRWAWGVTSLTAVTALLLAQTPALSSFLHLSPLHRADWILVVAGGVITAMLTALTVFPGQRA